ncbi:MAG: sugar ABC transporter permease [Lachnospiraceae bacterium]|nr:sugar ABC transporter permease [Lachnospiraceae bacterium]
MKAIKFLKAHMMKIILVLLTLYFWLMTKDSSSILMPANVTALINQNAYVYVLGTGMMMCMLIKGNIDLSVGAVVCFVDTVGAIFMVKMGLPVPVVMLAMLIVGLVIGVFMGWIIAYLNIPPWIATLAGYLSFRGLGTAIVKGQTIGIGQCESYLKLFNGSVPGLFNIAGLNGMCVVIGVVACLIVFFTSFKDRATKLKKGYEADSLVSVLVKCVLISAVLLFFTYKLGQDKGIPFSLVWVAVIVLIYNFIASKTVIGRYFYTMGGNIEAARLSGIDTKKVLFLAYLNMQFLTVITSWISMARLSAANPNAGLNYELDAISACIVGGVSAYGGSGSVFGMIVGATLIGVINLGMSLMNTDPNWQKVIKGLVLLGAVVFDVVFERLSTRAKK